MKFFKKSLLLMTLIAMFPAFSKETSQVIDDVPLKETTPPGDRPRDVYSVPISCYILGSTGCVWFVSSTISTSADVELVNTTTGTVTSDTVYISSTPDSVALTGPGDYTLEITLPSGASYYGTFTY